MNLQPGDILLSWKDPGRALWPPRALMERFGHWRLQEYGKRLYPSGDVSYDHVRVVCGPVFPDTPKLVLGFEFTHPAARYFWFPLDPDHWMYGASYSKLFRPNDKAMTDSFKAMTVTKRARLLHQKCLPWNGSLYDIGQLIDMGLGFHRFLDFGRKRKVCSVGARIVQEGGGVLLPNLFPEVKLEKTPPCSWANSPYFEAVV